MNDLCIPKEDLLEPILHSEATTVPSAFRVSSGIEVLCHGTGKMINN
jgi:hypothetical protein